MASTDGGSAMSGLPKLTFEEMSDLNERKVLFWGWRGCTERCVP